MIRETNYDEVFDAQEHFRILLDSMARPGTIYSIKKDGLNIPKELNEASALIALSLLNTDVSFYVNSRNETVQEYIKINTFSKVEKAEDANFLFISGTDSNEIIFQTKVGELEYPETSATLIIDVEEISAKEKNGLMPVNFAGPGVDGTKTLYFKGISQEILSAIKMQNSEYPLGVDTIITDKTRQVICIPRTNKFSWN